MKVRLAALFIVAALVALVLIASSDAAAPAGYLPGEGGSYYAWHDYGVICNAWAATWHLLLYWTGAGWDIALPAVWSCF